MSSYKWVYYYYYYYYYYYSYTKKTSTQNTYRLPEKVKQVNLVFTQTGTNGTQYSHCLFVPSCFLVYFHIHTFLWYSNSRYATTHNNTAYKIYRMVISFCNKLTTYLQIRYELRLWVIRNAMETFGLPVYKTMVKLANLKDYFLTFWLTLNGLNKQLNTSHHYSAQ